MNINLKITRVSTLLLIFSACSHSAKQEKPSDTKSLYSEGGETYIFYTDVVQVGKPDLICLYQRRIENGDFTNACNQALSKSKLNLPATTEGTSEEVGTLEGLHR